MRDVIVKYHPAFNTSRDLQRYGLANPEIFNVERLVEESLAAVGGYEFIDADHADFSDGTDSKTASIRERPTQPGRNTFMGEITGVETAAGGQKSGALRCTIYNPHKDSLKFYYLPKYWWRDHILYHPTSGIGKIRYTYNVYHDDIIKFDGFECESFEHLARYGH